MADIPMEEADLKFGIELKHDEATRYHLLDQLYRIKPNFKIVGRNTLKIDIKKIYNEKKQKTMVEIDNNASKVAITTDLWTANNSKRSFMYQSAPTNRVWEVAQIVCEKLGYFHKVTELLSDTAYPTANTYFPSVFQLKMELNQWLSSEDELVKKMAAKMLAKFDKYWSDVHDIVSLAIVLDPRYKLMLLTFYFNKMYGGKANEEIDKVKNLLFSYFQTLSSTSTSSAAHEHDDTMRDYDLFVSNATTNIGQRGRDIISEFELYTSEKVAPRTEQFDVLGWWKHNGSKYPTLQRIGRDILAIPMTTVASESAFSTSPCFPAFVLGLYCFFISRLSETGSQSLKNININVYYGGPLVNPEEINGFPFRGPGIECYYMMIRQVDTEEVQQITTSLQFTALDDGCTTMGDYTMGSYMLPSQVHAANTGETIQPQETHLGEEDEDEDEDEDHAAYNGENIDDMDEYEERIEQGDFDRDVDDHELVPNFEEENMVYHDEGDVDDDIGVQHDTNTTIAYTPPAESFYTNTWENMVDPSCLRIPFVSTWEDGMHFSKGLNFANKEVVKRALIIYAAGENRNFIIRRSTKTKLCTTCIDTNCKWYVGAFMKAKLNSLWMVTSYVWDAKQKAIAKIFGDWEESYQRLQKLLLAYLDQDSGTQYNYYIIPRGIDGTALLRYVFWAFAPCIAAFRYCRPVISFDGTHLYGKYRGVLMIAMATNANQKVLPLAFAVVDKESRAS
ncbi:hypothetical protein SO802_010166 [Lithocarpus litseifolius]|uniref:Transposase n=1 Tax=Lithocarpus litseifolius TaxID=425828 RepID=A0AAW2DGI9_9ROSI